jgi:hypothetical protein
MKVSYYFWGQCGKEMIKEPKETELKSYNDIFVICYSGITYGTLTIDFELNLTKEAIKQNALEETVVSKESKTNEKSKKQFQKRYKIKRFHDQNFEK